MRDPINVLYYPEFFADYTTVMKAILLFDEVHFMDRPSMAFNGGRGQLVTVGAASPLRQYEASFREQGVPLFVHAAPMGSVEGEWYEQIREDVNDLEFLRRFQKGITTSPSFRALQIPPGVYGAFGDQDDVARLMMAIDLPADLGGAANPMALFEDAAVRLTDLSHALGRAKHLVMEAVVCSAKLNFALSSGTREGFFPLADASPYGDLLGAKYARAIGKLDCAGNRILPTDLSFAVFDELISAERLRQLKISDVIRYRKESQNAREEFLEHLRVLQAKQAAIGPDGDYLAAIEELIETEIKPVVRTFQKRLKTIDEALFGAMAKGVVGAAGGSSVATVFGDLSWPKILALASAAAAYTAKAAIDAVLAKRAARRECSISYVLSLE